MSDDSDLNLETSSHVPSEPRSYRSIEDIDENDDLEGKLKRRLGEIKDSSKDSHSGTSSPLDSSTRKTSASLSPRSEKGEDHAKHPAPTDETTKRKRSAEHKSRDDRRKKSIEKRKSLERMSRKAKGDIPGAFDL